MAELKSFLRQAARRPFVWGRSDCVLTGADWVLEVEGWDPADGFRGQYDTEAQAEAFLVLSGGLVEVIQHRMRRAATSQPRAGDIGVVVTEGPRGRAEVTAICTGRRWAAKSPGGIWIGPAECLAAWRVG